jgi:hypothetical protein
LAGEPGAINAESFEPPPRQPDEPLSETDEATVRMWLADIGETDEDVINAVLNVKPTRTHVKRSSSWPKAGMR